jgi:hypothetical protein
MGRLRKTAKFLEPIFQANGWKWAQMDHSGDSVPSEEDIYATLKRLKEHVKESKGFIETGRLMARWNRDMKQVDYFLELPADKENIDA